MPDNNTSNNSARRRQRATTPIDTGLGHMPPQSVETERTVLGALMIDKDAFTVVSEILRPETFYEPRNQKVFAAIQTLSVNERPVDLVTVTEQLTRDGTLEDVGGQLYIYELTANVASSAHVEYHARILAQKFLARQLIHFASDIETKSFDESNDIEVVMQEAEGQLFELSQKNMRQDYTQIDPVVKQAVAIMQKAASNTGGLTGVPSGFTKLDDITSGWQKSDLIIIAGRPAMGKTSFALSIAKNVAVDQRIPVAFFSLEMNNVQLVNRLISNTCEIEGKKVMTGQLSDADWDRFDRNIRKLEGAPLYVDETPGLSIFELRTKARRLAREKKVELIMIDYLQLMNANGMRFGNRQEEVSNISRSLKQSGAIEQDADMVLFVHRPEYYHILHDEQGNDLRGMAQIIIAKHRKGAVGDVLLNFRGEFTRFANPEDTYVPPTQGGEIMGSRINGGYDDPLGPPPPPAVPF